MAAGSQIGALFVRLLLDDEAFDLETPKKSLQKFGSQLDSIAQKVEDVFVGAMKAAAASVAGLTAAAAVVGATFEAQMTQVGVIAGSTAEDLQALEDKARELGASTAYSASEAAGAMQLLAGAGLKTNQILAATESVLTLAGAGGTDLNTSAGLLVSTLAQFQLEAGESARIADVFAKATSNSQFRVDDLAEALKYGGTVGAGFGWSLEQTTAALAMFRDLGLQGSKAGTALRSAMVGATTASQQNAAVLAKYGLTLTAISPDTNSFYQIIEKVGRAGMTTSDAMIVFGAEAGAALNTIARSAAEGNGRYLELVATLEDAAGASAEMYGKMQDNVLGSFKELQSAVEEGMLTLFDAFGGPLGRLLDALTEKIGVVVEYFRANSAGITAELNRQVDAVISWLGQNQEIIAVAFTEGAAAVVELVGVLGQLVPLLDELAILVTATFVAKKVAEFVTAVQTAITGVRAFQAALVAANVEMTVATGGLWAAVAAMGAAVAAIALLVSAYGEAEQAARKLRMEQQKQVEVTQEASDRLLESYGRQITASKASAEGKRLELAASGKLTAAKREELDLLRKSTEGQLAALIAQGKLVENAGELRTVASLYEDLEEDAVAPVTRRLQQMRQEQADLLGQANRIDRWVQDWGRLAGGAADAAAQASGFAGGLAEAEARAKALRGQAQQLAGAIKSLDDTNTDAQARLLETYSKDGQVSRGMEGLSREAKSLGKDQEDAAAKAQEAWERAFEAATTAAAQAAQQQREMLEDAQASEAEALDLKHQRERKELERAQAEALALVEQDAVARLMVEGQFARARADAEKRQAIEVAAFQREQVREELEKRQRALEEYLAERRRIADAVLGLERENMGRMERFDAEVADFFAENARMTAQERVRAEAAFLVQRQKLLDEEAQAVAQAAQEERDLRRESIDRAVAQARAAVTSIANVARGVVDGVRGAGGAARDLLGGLVTHAKQAAMAIAEVFSAITGGAVSLDALGYLQQAMDAIASGDAEGSVGDVAAAFVREMGANAQAFLDGVIQGLPTVARALLEQVPVLVQALAQALPALAAEVAALVPEVVQVLAENIPVLVEAIAQALPVVVQALVDAIPGLVQILAENLPVLVRALVDNLGPLVEALAGAIPGLVQVLADNLPPLVEAIAQGVPVIIRALVDGLPVLVSAIVDSIPFLVEAVKQSIPLLVEGIIEAAPALIMGLLDAALQLLPVIIRQLTVLVSAFVGMLPDVIDAVIAGLPDIIHAIVAAIPVIVTAVVEAVPGIITAIIAGLPDIILALVNGILAAVPDIVIAVVMAVPEIAVALVKAMVFEFIPRLPEIVWALITGLANGIWKIAKAFWNEIKGLFSRDDRKDGRGKKDKGSNYSGISYVPATMRGVTLHQGEAVLTADENHRRLFGGAAGASQSNPGVPVLSPSSAGGGQPIEALFAVDGRVVDGVMVRASANGKGQIVGMMKRTAGVKAGIKASGRYKLWTR